VGGAEFDCRAATFRHAAGPEIMTIRQCALVNGPVNPVPVGICAQDMVGFFIGNAAPRTTGSISKQYETASNKPRHQHRARKTYHRLKISFAIAYQRNESSA
jgi:hypothetical protein